MPTVQPGDRVRVHYVKRFQDGSSASSRGKEPLELTVGVHDPRLPGLGLALVGLSPGARTTLHLRPEEAYGLADPARVRRWARSRFPADRLLPVGMWVRLTSRRGRRRVVRILEVGDKTVVVDTNHRRAGLALELEVQLVAIDGPSGDLEARAPGQRKVVAFDVDAESLASLRSAFPGWEIETVQEATTDSLEQDWSPRTADLLLVGARDQADRTLALCRGLRSQAGRAHTPLLVLVTPEQQAVVTAALAAGAHGCLVLPIHAKELASGVARAVEGNRPGRHTLGTHQPQVDCPWQDEGGEA